MARRWSVRTVVGLGVVFVTMSVVRGQTGTVSAFGNNFSGELGDGTTIGRAAPARMSGLSGVTAIAAGDGFSLALDEGGQVWACGWNAGGQLGDDSYTDRWAPVPNGMTSAVAIAAGGYHGLALDRQGRVHAWGANSYGQLGRSSADVWNSKLPLVVPGLPSIVAIAAGEEHSLALDRQGRVWAWGKNSTGQSATERRRIATPPPWSPSTG